MSRNSVELEYQKLVGFLKLVNLNEREVNVYLLGLEKIRLSSGDIVNFLGISAQTASDIIKRLAGAGFFIPEVQKGRKGAGGKGKIYRVVPPSQKFPELQGISSAMDRIDEILENTEGIEVEDGFWELRKEETAHSILIEQINNVNSEILISSNDCSWIEESSITRCLANCAQRNILIKVIVNNASPETCKILESLGAKVYPCTSTISPSYVILDKKLLFMAFSTSQYSRRYGLLQLNNQYLISKFSGMFNSMIREAGKHE